jgi:anaerobic magnesium-protoporphyrin IX monomethyl ester cyclase
MSWVALVGPEYEENLSLRYIAASLGAAGYSTEILPFNREQDLPQIVWRIVQAPEPPLLVGLSLAFQWRAKDFLALAMALRQSGYRGHITAGGHFATFACREILQDFPELDSICRQEAEETVVSLTRAIEATRVFVVEVDSPSRNRNRRQTYRAQDAAHQALALADSFRKANDLECR